MKKIKIILDIIMSVTLFFLIVIYITGNYLHEVLGIAFIIEFTIHKLLNSKNIVILLKQFFSNNCKKIIKTTVITDILLTIFMILSSISGIFISKYLFKIESEYSNFWYIVHTITSYLSVVIVIFHMYTHTRYIVNAMNNMFNIKYKKIQEYLFNSFLVICFGLLINLFFKNDTLSKVKNIYYLNKEQIENKDSKIVNENLNIYNVESNETIQEDKNVVIKEKVVPSDLDINKYLSGLRCNGCKKRCLLTFPECIIGEQQAKIKTEEYIKNYSAE
jgi:hypothetical protein